METLIVFAGTYLIYAVGLVGVGAWLLSPKGGKRRILVIGIGSLLVGFLLSAGAGMFFSHPQPFAIDGFEPLIPHDVDNAFPSHHALAAGIAAAVVFLFHRRLGAVLFLAAIAVGWGRIAAGLHVPVDVAAGLGIALLSTYLVSRAVSRFLPSMLESGDTTPRHGTTDTA